MHRMCLQSVTLILCMALVFCQENLSPQNSTVALGKNGTFSCTSMEQVFWEVTPNLMEEVTVFLLDGDEEPRSVSDIPGIFISTITIGSHIRSVLTIEGSIANNFTEVSCTIPRSGSLNYPSPVILRVFGPPAAPVLQASPQGGNVSFSWLPAFSPYSIPVSYDVQLKDSMGTSLYSMTTNSTSFIHIPQKDFCSTIHLEVFAFNMAGISNESELVYNMTTEPNTEAIATSIEHEVLIRSGQITCEIHFDPVCTCGCPEYPVTHYRLTLQQTYSNESYSLGPFTEPPFSINSSYIRANARYSYIVEAVNMINISSAIEEREFYTTDVQVSRTAVTCNSVIVECMFVPGSQSRGCSLQLTINGYIITRNIKRVNGSDHVREEIVVSSAGITVEEFLAFDWESDGSIGSVRVPAGITLNCSDVSPTSDRGPNSTTGEGFPYLLPVSAAVPAALLISVLLLLIIIICCFLAVRKKQGAHDNSSMLRRNGGTRPAVLHAYNPTPHDTFFSSRLNFKENDASELTEQKYHELSYPSSHVWAAPESATYSQIGERKQTEEPIYCEVANNSSVAVSPNQPQSDGEYSQPEDCTEPERDHSQPDGYYSQLGAEREYAVLESGRTFESINSPPLPAFAATFPLSPLAVTPPVSVTLPQFAVGDKPPPLPKHSAVIPSQYRNH